MADHDEPKGYSDEHARIFAHVGVTNLEDWEAVAREMFKRHAPELLEGAIKAKGRRGRPMKWDALTVFRASQAVDHVQTLSAAGEIRRDLSHLTTACQFLADDTPEALALRKQFSIPDGTTMENLRNRVSDHRSGMKGHAS